MKLKNIAQKLDTLCRPNCSIADQDLSDVALKRVLFYRAKIDDNRWPFNSLSAHRYALRMIRQLDINSQFEFCEVYDSIVSDYVNNPKNQ